MIGKQLRTQDGRVGFSLNFFNDAPWTPNRELLEERDETDFSPFSLDYSHPNLHPVWYADAEGYFTLMNLVPMISGCVFGEQASFISMGDCW